VVVLLPLLVALASPGADLDDLLARFWAAPTVAGRAVVADEVVTSGVGFGEVLAGLRRGRDYSADVPRGRLLRERTGVGGLRHPYMILVPEDYTPGKRWPVRLDLHGGMGAEEWKGLDGAWSPHWRAAHEQIVVVPAGWWDSMWWEWSQVENLEAILREVRATWNVDENAVVAFGSSDGGATLFFLAMRQPDRLAGLAGTVAPPDRLTIRCACRTSASASSATSSGTRSAIRCPTASRGPPSAPTATTAGPGW
jgi:poly(3-hydroxybutyrate) depolymerase